MIWVIATRNVNFYEHEVFHVFHLKQYGNARCSMSKSFHVSLNARRKIVKLAPSIDLLTESIISFHQTFVDKHMTLTAQ